MLLQYNAVQRRRNYTWRLMRNTLPDTAGIPVMITDDSGEPWRRLVRGNHRTMFFLLCSIVSLDTKHIKKLRKSDFSVITSFFITSFHFPLSFLFFFFKFYSCVYRSYYAKSAQVL